MGCVYLARNRINEKCYIGKTIKKFETRKRWHERSSIREDGWYFHRSLKRYGLDSFEWEILFESASNEELCAAEIRLISKLNTRRPNGYNLTSGGDGVRDLDSDTINRMALFHTGRKRSDETRKRISDACKGLKRRLGAILSDETKLRISIGRKGKFHSEESKAKIGLAMSKIKKTEVQKQKMSAARSAWWLRKKQSTL